MPTALLTGGSRGIGRGLLRELVAVGWHVITDGRDADVLAMAAATTSDAGLVTTVPGDVTDLDHRAELAGAVADRGPLHLLVNNAGALGPSPLPTVAEVPADELRRVLDVNVVAPVALVAACLDALHEGAGAIVQLTSDAAHGAWPGWGPYGASKVALEHLSAVLAVEEPGLRVWSLDPGNVATDMHQRAFPGQDISDRDDPADVAQALLALLRERPPSGRHRAADLLAATREAA